MRELSVQVLQVSASEDEAGLRQKWLGRREMSDLPSFASREQPSVYVVRNEDLPVLRTQCGARVEDRGTKHKAVPLSRMLLRRKSIPLVNGSYTSAGQLLRSVRTLLDHAQRDGDMNSYFIGASEEVFGDLWRRASWSSSKERVAGGDAEAAGAEVSTLLMNLLPEEPEPEDVASRYVGTSLEARLVRQLALKARATTEPVLIIGEPGTGKELVARAIHGSRPRVFIHANCAAIGEAGFEVEFFGEPASEEEERPAKPGLWEMASLGTLYLEEINALTIPQQIRLERAMSFPGKHPPRVVASSDRSLPAMVESKLFRDSLYYRLRRFTIYTPALREHPQDIAPMANTAWRAITGRTAVSLPDDVISRLEQQSWPGNVGELKAVLHQLHALFGSTPLKAGHVDAVLRNAGRAPKPTAQELALSHRLECMNHMTRTSEVIQAARMATQPLVARRNPTSDIVRGVREQLLRRLTELDVLCLKPLRFGGHAVYTAVYELKGKLHYFGGQLPSDRKSAMRFWQSDLAARVDSVIASLFDETRRLAGKTAG